MHPDVKDEPIEVDGRVVIVNTHGGNLIPKLAVRALNLNQSRGQVLLTFPPQLAETKVSSVFDQLDDEQHVGDLETSLMLHLEPDEVGEDRVDRVPEMGAVFFDYATMRSYCPDGAWGRANRATEDKGRRALEIMVEETGRHARATFARLDDGE